MRALRLVFSSVVFVLLAALARAQVPTASGSIAAQALALGATPATFNLQTVFTLPGVSGQVVQFDTVFGKFNVELRADAAPQHVTNFLTYVQSGAYTNTVVHRSQSLISDALPVSIVQSGSFRAPITNGTLPTIPTLAPVPLEYNLPNARGTLAMARGSNINSATSGFYFNVLDNSADLGPANGGGYTVFGRVIGTGMTVVDSIATAPRVDASGGNVNSPFGYLPVRNWTPGTPILDANLVLINSITSVPVYPSVSGASAMTFSVETSNGNVATADLAGSLLRVTPVGAGNATITVRAADPNGNSATTSFNVTITPGPQFTTQPFSQGVNQGGTVILTASTSGAASYQWRRNGADVAGATSSSLTLNNAQPADAGVYTVVATDVTGSNTSQGAVVGLTSNVKVVGSGSEVGVDIMHQNGNVYDQVLLTGSAATVKADNGQVLRISYIDLNNDIVQVEFSGAGALTLALDSATGPAAPSNYNQPTVQYMKGHATITIAGANETTNVSVFSVGRATAFDPTGGYNILQAPSSTNNPANNGSSLFVGHPIGDYDAMADIATIAIASTNGKFGGVRTSNASYFATRGFTGVYAPGVQFTGPVFVGDISASDNATPTILLGDASDVRITGGDLQQANGRAVQVDGMTRIQMAAGTNSQGTAQAAQPIRGRLERNGVDVTSQLTTASDGVVVSPSGG